MNQLIFITGASVYWCNMHCACCLTQCSKLKNLEKNTFRILTWRHIRLISIIKLEKKVNLMKNILIDEYYICLRLRKLGKKIIESTRFEPCSKFRKNSQFFLSRNLKKSKILDFWPQTCTTFSYRCSCSQELRKH